MLTAFSLALGVPSTTLREAPGLPPGESDPFVLPESVKRLNSRQRELVLHTVRVLLDE